jgi:hypothetical protein
MMFLPETELVMGKQIRATAVPANETYFRNRDAYLSRFHGTFVRTFVARINHGRALQRTRHQRDQKPPQYGGIP